jgi:hypothetical protein
MVLSERQEASDYRANLVACLEREVHQIGFEYEISRISNESQVAGGSDGT